MPDNIETTSDLYYASYLHAVGATFVRVERKQHRDGQRCFFVYDLSSAANEDAGTPDSIRAAWINETAVVNACDFRDAVIKLKRLVHAA